MNLIVTKHNFLLIQVILNGNERPEFIESLSEKNVHNYVKDIINLLESEVKKNKKDTEVVNEKVKENDKELRLKEIKIKEAEDVNNNFLRLDELLKKEVELNSQKNYFDNKQKKVDDNQKILAIVVPKEQMYIRNQEEIKVLMEKLKENNEILQKLVQFEESIKIKDIKVNELKLKNETLKTQKDKLQKLKETIDNVNVILKAFKERDELTKKFDLENSIFREAENRYRIEEDKFYKEQAGILAENLKEGTKCPVCRKCTSS